MDKEQLRKELNIIFHTAIETNKKDYNALNAALFSAERGECNKTPYGKLYVQRLKELLELYDVDTCIICGKNHASNKIVCSECFNKLKDVIHYTPNIKNPSVDRLADVLAEPKPQPQPERQRQSNQQSNQQRTQPRPTPPPVRQRDQERNNHIGNDDYKYRSKGMPLALKFFIFIVGACWVLFIGSMMLGSCGKIFSDSPSSGSSTSTYKSKEQRCSWCGKVIVNSDGRPIHKSNGKCTYCGMPN